MTQGLVRTKIINIMLGCRNSNICNVPVWAVLVAVCLAGVARADPPTRAAVVIWSEDPFSSRAAQILEHLGTSRLDRQPGLSALPAHALVIGEEDRAARKTLNMAAENAAAGATAYENLEPLEAIDHLLTAITGFERHPVYLTGKAKKTYLEALTYLGSSQILKGEPQVGQDTFRKLLLIERRTKLDKRLFPPGMVRMFESARQEVTAGAMGTVAVFSSPGNAKVFVNEIFRGVTPCTVERLPEGLHLVIVHKAGYQPWGKMVAVSGADETPVNCRLLDVPGGDELMGAVEAAADQLGSALAPRMQSLAQARGLGRLLVGRLSKRGEGVAYDLAWYYVGTGESLRTHSGSLQPESAGFAKTVDSVFSYLITGRGDVIQSPTLVAESEPLRLKDEALFEEVEVPVYERWYFWTAIGVGVAAVLAVSLGLTLAGDDEPGSQILLEF